MSNASATDLVARAKTNIPSISCAAYRKMKESGEDFVLLDVREQDEWESGHMEEAIHIPRGFLEFKIEESVPSKDANVILCCAKGGRSALSAQTLKQMGYTNVRFLEGGYEGYCESEKTNLE